MLAISSIIVSPEVMPGTERVGELRKKITDIRNLKFFLNEVRAKICENTLG